MYTMLLEHQAGNNLGCSILNGLKGLNRIWRLERQSRYEISTLGMVLITELSV